MLHPHLIVNNKAGTSVQQFYIIQSSTAITSGLRSILLLPRVCGWVLIPLLQGENHFIPDSVSRITYGTSFAEMTVLERVGDLEFRV